jgi:hypothetical protein
MKKRVLITGSIFVIIFIFLVILFNTYPALPTSENGTFFDCQVGHFNEQNDPVVEPKFVKYPGVFSKYLLSNVGTRPGEELHCIVPYMEISSNKRTIWGVFFPMYYFDITLVYISSRGDTTNAFTSISLLSKNNKLYLRILLNGRLNTCKNIPVCDPVFIKPCMIKN